MKGQYSCRWACFNCRKAFKAHSAWSFIDAIAINHNEDRICPECAGTMHDLGQDFQPPRKDSINQWKKIALLYERGTTFHSCGCRGPGTRPKTFSEAKHNG